MKLPPRLASWLQAAPLALILLLFFGLPMLVVVVVSFFDYDMRSIIPGFILDNYPERVRTRSVTLPALSRIRSSSPLIVWAVTLLIGFNVAYFLVFHVRSLLWQIGLFLLCTVPFWTSNIIRMISWIPFLGPQRHLQPGAARSSALIQSAAGIPAVLGFRGRPRLCPSLHAVHGGADLQLDGAHRPQPDGGGARRRRRPLADRRRDRDAALARPASPSARSSSSRW